MLLALKMMLCDLYLFENVCILIIIMPNNILDGQRSCGSYCVDNESTIKDYKYQRMKIFIFVTIKNISRNKSRM